VPASAHHRRPLVAALGLATALTLTACSGGTPAGTDDASTEASLLPAAEGTTEYPLTLETFAGETVLDERPERVAVVGFSPNYDALEAIGVTPVYALADSEWQWNDQELRESGGFVGTATRADPIDFEGIAAAEPDLIIATNFIFEQEDYDKLAAIAPVLENPEQVDGAAIDWRDTQRLIGETLDLAEAAESAVTAADGAIAAVADAHPGFAGTTATIAYHYTGSPLEYYSPSGGTLEQLLLDLGFDANPLAEQFAEVPEVPDENLAQLEADRLVVFYDSDEERVDRESRPLFQAIPAVAEGRYLPVVLADAEGVYSPEANVTWVLRRGASALSLPWAAEILAGWLEQAGQA
jgi:iron complex transport system substrate-binding protein